MVLDKFNLAWISLTYRCNSRCLWCYAGSNDYQAMKDKSLSVVRQDGVISLIKDLGIKRVTLIGGEPSIYEGVEDFVYKIKSAEIRPGMVSNGRKFKDKSFVSRMRSSGLANVTFSIEGSSSEIHDRTTQVRGSFNESFRGMENVVNAEIPLSTNTVISSLNLNDLESVIDKFHELKLVQMSFNVSGVCVSKGDNPYMIHPKVAVSAFERAYKHAKNRGIKTKLVTPVPLCYFDPNLLNELKSSGSIGVSPCQISHGRNFVMDYNGDVVPCTHLTGYPLFNSFLSDRVMNGTEFISEYNKGDAVSFRNSMTRYASVNCEGCSEKCSGGCPLFWMKYNPDDEIKSRKVSLTVLN